MQAINPERVGPSKEVDLLPAVEEKLDGLDLEGGRWYSDIGKKLQTLMEPRASTKKAEVNPYYDKAHLK